MILSGESMLQPGVKSGSCSLQLMKCRPAWANPNKAWKVKSGREQKSLRLRNDAVKSNVEKRKLIHKVNTIAEFERKSIAVEIHDELNATLVGAKFDSQRILALIDKIEQETPKTNEIMEPAQSITKLTKDLYAAGRAIVTRLRPEILDTLGLSKAIEELVNHFNRSQNARCSHSNRMAILPSLKAA